MANATKQQLTADAAYEHAHMINSDLLIVIRDLMHDMPAPGSDDSPINWSHVGDVNHVNNQLSEIVAFLNSCVKGH